MPWLHLALDGKERWQWSLHRTRAPATSSGSAAVAEKGKTFARTAVLMNDFFFPIACKHRHLVYKHKMPKCESA